MGCCGARYCFYDAAHRAPVDLTRQWPGVTDCMQLGGRGRITENVLLSWDTPLCDGARSWHAGRALLKAQTRLLAGTECSAVARRWRLPCHGQVYTFENRRQVAVNYMTLFSGSVDPAPVPARDQLHEYYVQSTTGHQVLETFSQSDIRAIYTAIYTSHRLHYWSADIRLGGKLGLYRCTVTTFRA